MKRFFAVLFITSTASSLAQAQTPITDANILTYLSTNQASVREAAGAVSMEQLINAMGEVVVYCPNVFNDFRNGSEPFCGLLDKESIEDLRTYLGVPSTSHTHAFTSLTSLPTIPTITPQSAITDAAADASTSLSPLTTSLSDLVTEINAANTKQNAVAEKLNAVIAALEANGLLTP